ncbi:hypothetical protein UlMin_012533 [Ulmus minor]
MEENNESRREMLRVFVGGLGEAVAADELRRMFELAGGAVEGLDFVRTKGRSFAYVDFVPSSDKSLSKLFAKYNGCMWKGGRLKLEKAKEHYLLRLRREWDEDAGAATAAEVPPSEVNENLSTPGKSFGNLSTPEKLNLQMYFPKLRKMKLLPFSGTGKHKYSFQRFEVNSLPKWFCDCEEHAGPPLAEKEKRTSHLDTQSGGMNEEEVDIMNKVLNAFLQKQNDDSNVVHDDGTIQPDNGDSPELVDEDESDEDNLILNVVSGGNNRLALLESQQVDQVSKNQEPRSKDVRTRDVLAMQTGKDNVPSNNKRKSLPNDKSSENEFQSALSTGKERDNGTPNKKKKLLPKDNKSSGNRFEASISACREILPTYLEKPGKVLPVQPAETESGIRQSFSHVSWSQKSSWRELVGDRENNAFSISGVLSGTASNEKEETRSDAVPECDSKIPNPERDVELEDAVCETKTEELVEAKPTEPNVEVCETKTKELVEAKPAKPNLEVSQAKTEEAKPADPNVVSMNSGRGAFWRQKSSWTQLVNESSNTPFSITQILPGITFDQQVVPKGMNIAHSTTDSQPNKIIDTPKDDPTVSATRKEDHVSGNPQEKNEQSVLEKKESDSLVTEKTSVGARQASKAKVESSDASTFMRSSASMREWQKAKAAFSGSLKRKGPRK